MAIPYLRAQRLKRTELELLDSAFRFAKTLGNFADAAFLDEALADDAALYFRKLFDKAKKVNVALDKVQIG
jgi:hypothetical protein